jgi:hypothetical protein
VTTAKAGMAEFPAKMHFQLASASGGLYPFVEAEGKGGD